jgi:undecaprenyl-diphosphatase
VIAERRPTTLAHPWIVAATAAVVLGVSYLVARARPVPAWETDLTRAVNGVPAWVAHALWPVMQLGTLWAPVVVALVVGLVRRDWLLAACIAGAGGVTWVAAKLVKRFVERGRPRVYMPDVVVRDGSGGFGYISGHSAMAAAIAVVVMAAVPRRGRPVLVLIAALVGIARVVHGVHLPADLVGGWAFGVLVGLAALAVYDRWSDRTLPPNDPQPVTS